MSLTRWNIAQLVAAQQRPFRGGVDVRSDSRQLTTTGRLGVTQPGLGTDGNPLAPHARKGYCRYAPIEF